MSQQVDGTLFDFGTIAETQILKPQNEVFLPYNPFTFDMSLRIIKSIEPYESNISFLITAGSKSIFGRKKVEVEHVLKAPTVSSKHFLIDEHQRIKDLGSTKGTFVWVQRDKAADLDKGKSFLIGKSSLTIQKITLLDRRIVVKLDNKLIELNKKDSPILVGNHKKCSIRIPGKEYFAAIDLINLKMYNFLENEDYDLELGVWEKLQGKADEEGRQIDSQDLIMVYPYILKVEY